jgi:large subunit ribosomal protein L21
MYAVVKTGGKQYKVSEGDFFKVEKVPGEIGDSVVFDQVLLVGGGDGVRVGRPLLDGLQVTGTIVEQGREKKIIVFKMKRRKGYRKKQGHRQYYTGVKVTGIAGGLQPEPERTRAEVPAAKEAVAEVPAPAGVVGGVLDLLGGKEENHGS